MEYKDEKLIDNNEVFDDDKDLYKYLYQFEQNNKNANLVLAYLHSEPRKKTFVRNQRKLMKLINDFLISKLKHIEILVKNQYITFNEKTKKIEYIINENETQKQAEEKIKKKAKEIEKEMIKSTESVTDFLYNIIESISILERNREDNHFANQGFGKKDKNIDETDNLFLKKLKDEEKEKK